MPHESLGGSRRGGESMAKRGAGARAVFLNRGAVCRDSVHTEAWGTPSPDPPATSPDPPTPRLARVAPWGAPRPPPLCALQSGPSTRAGGGLGARGASPQAGCQGAERGGARVVRGIAGEAGGGQRRACSRSGASPRDTRARRVPPAPRRAPRARERVTGRPCGAEPAVSLPGDAVTPRGAARLHPRSPARSRSATPLAEPLISCARGARSALRAALPSL